MQFIQFNNEKIDSFLFMELLDLSQTLTKNEELTVEFAMQSYYDPLNQIVTISHFWKHRREDLTREGLKSDVYLRCIGNHRYSEFSVFREFLKSVDDFRFPEFAKQLFVLAEDIRIEELSKKDRSGTKKAFQTRRLLYREFFQSQLNMNMVRGMETDALFNVIYLLLTTDRMMEHFPPFSERMTQVLPALQQSIFKLFETSSTSDVMKQVKVIMNILDEVLHKDLFQVYFYLPELFLFVKTASYRDLLRDDPLKKLENEAEQKSGDEDVHDEHMPVWHRETSDKTNSFLQFDLEQGTNSDLIGEGIREGESGDQAFPMIQGSSKKSEMNKFDDEDTIQKQAAESGDEQTDKYGKENSHAVAIFEKPNRPSNEEILKYSELKSSIMPYSKKLKTIIQKTLEHKKTLPRSDLPFGRLNKKLIRLITDENPRLFYKKGNPSPEINAAFTLLVDCSASMSDKMDQTKLGIILFHEALKALSIEHEIIGFYEDANHATDKRQPNYFKTVIDFTSSRRAGSGPEILQLEAEEDNRDGFAIRLASERLWQRLEKQKFLLVFSDGQPAAYDYEQSGIIDTHEAVLEARKKGIEVINVFLANRQLEEHEQKNIENIYGRFSVIVENIDELPDMLFPLLRKLLLKSLES